MRALLRRRGSSLVLNLFALALFASLAVIVAAGTKSQIKATIFVERQAQAQAIAEAGLEDARHSLAINSSWRTGFTAKSFAGGTYTVTLTTGNSTTITSTGYSASMLLIGAAVKTVSMVATSTITAGCPYALQANNSMTISGKVDAYDPTSSLTPCSTCFIAGADVWNNTNIDMSGGATCPPVRIRGVAYMGGSGTLSSAACAESGTSSTAGTLTIAPSTCSGCTTSIDLSNVPANSTITLTAGSYVTTGGGGKIKLNAGSVLNVNTSSGAVKIAFNGNVDTAATSQINNTTKIPSRLQFIDTGLTGAGHTVALKCATPLHAYLESNNAQFTIAQEVYGHFCGNRVNLSSTTGAVGLVHYDLGSGGVATVNSGSYQESYKRQ